MLAELTFGQWLKRRRKALDWTQAELAQKVPCALGTIRRLEADTLRASKPLAERLAEVLEVTAAHQAAFVAFARDVTQPDELQLPTALADSVWPPTASTLPAPPNPLIGRAHLVAAARALLLQPEVRLLTALGPPGVGKTRLALQIAHEMEEHWAEGLCFVPLASLTQASRLPEALAQALGLINPTEALTAVRARLQAAEILLLLDNVEHLLTEDETLVRVLADLLAHAPRLKVLCTSRVALRLSGEHEFEVPPLALPDVRALSDLSAIAQAPAVALLCARARAVLPSFALTAENAPMVIEICQRLDGLPLAIELAATRLKLLSLEALRSRLENRLPLLTTGPRDAPARQRTLEAAIRWSYDLLTEKEKAIFAQLSVFSGGWTLEAAENVVADEQVLEALGSLVNQSLVVSSGGGQRFLFLETLREFAHAQLPEPTRTLLRERHAAYFAALAEHGERGMQGPEQVRWMQTLRAEQANLQTALMTSLSATGEGAVGLRLASALWWFWWTNGQLNEARRWLQRLLHTASAPTEYRAKALLALGTLTVFASAVAEAQPHLEAAITLAEQLNLPVIHGYAEVVLGSARTAGGEVEHGLAMLEAGTERLRQTGEAGAWYLGAAYLSRALLGFHQQAAEIGRQAAQAALTVFQALGQPYGIGLAHNYLGDAARLKGDLPTATTHYALSLRLLRAAEIKSEVPAVLHNLGHVALAQGDFQQAEALFGEGLAMHQDAGNGMGVAECLAGLALIHAASGQPRRAARLFGIVTALTQASDLPMWASTQPEVQRALLATRTQLSAAEWQAAFEAGKFLSVNEALAPEKA